MTSKPDLRVLVTGFEPFERDPVNPSWEVARALDGWACEGAVVRAVKLQCEFGAKAPARCTGNRAEPLQASADACPTGAAPPQGMTR